MSRKYISRSALVVASFLTLSYGSALASSDDASRGKDASRQSDARRDESASREEETSELERARQWEEYVRSLTVTKAFLVVATFRSYAGAERAMHLIGKRTGIDVPAREPAVSIHDGELTYSAEVCEENGWDHPCYVARGRHDDGTYLSVEPSGAYDGMRPGYFFVIAASGSPEDVAAVARELRVRGQVRTSPVWMGCMH